MIGEGAGRKVIVSCAPDVFVFHDHEGDLKADRHWYFNFGNTGKAVFAGAGTCAKCHVVGSEGKAVGPNLSGIDATLPAGEIEELVKQPVSLMPADLAATLSVQELVDLVAWLETLKAQ